MKFYQRLEWQLALTIVILVGITITYTGLLQRTSVRIYLDEVPEINSVSNTQYRTFLEAATTPETARDIKAHANFLTTNFVANFPDTQDILVITDPQLNVVSANNPDFVYMELIRQEPDNDGYSVVLSSVYKKRELFQIYQSVPAYSLGKQGLALIVPDPTDTSQPDWQTQISGNLKKQFKSLGVYYLVIALFIILFVRLRLAPLRKLERFSRQLSSEKLPSPMSPSFNNDELNQLISGFNEALARLSSEKAQRTLLLADMAHELRTPLHNLKGRLELEAEGITARSEKATQYTLKQIDQLVRLVNDIDLMTSLDEPELSLQKVDMELKSFLQETLDVVCHGNKFTWEIEGNATLASIDSGRMVQVIENLVQNAVKAKPKNLKFHIAISKHQQHLLINLKDNGPGVPEAELPNLFNRLYRVDQSRHQDTGGSGLGLSIVKKIIELHDGNIESFLPEEGGLGFIITLPATT